MIERQANNPLHGITRKRGMDNLVEHYGWRKLARPIEIRCFIKEPPIKSSLKFQHKNPWARKEVEDLYLATQKIPGQP
ncbi:MAG: VF530 family DNA-binding protein [bacterium]